MTSEGGREKHQSSRNARRTVTKQWFFFRCGLFWVLLLSGNQFPKISNIADLPSTDFKQQQQKFNFTRTIGKYTTTSSTVWNETEDLTVVLQHQVRLQTEFLSLLHQNQHPKNCLHRRVVFPHNYVYDGFCWELQVMGHALVMGLATDRTVLLPENFTSAYAPPNCQWSESLQGDVNSTWNCLYEPLSSCTHETVHVSSNSVPADQSNLSSTKSILTRDSSKYFHAQYYGPKQRVRLRSEGWFKSGGQRYHIDHIEHWEREMGKYWLRAQAAHYLWKPSEGLRLQMEQRLPKIPDKYIGMHVRFSDNVPTMRNHFARDPAALQTVESFMKIARQVQKDSGISTVYLATDSAAVMHLFQDSISSGSNWTFLMQENVDRVSEGNTSWMWFKEGRSAAAPAIATDLEVLRRADVLIGSFSSNVYRVATQLNTAYHADRYPWHWKRHYATDIEWYEDP